jgi:hypothetical protein
VVATTPAGGGGAVLPGDRIQQANGARVTTCADLEQIADEALAKSLLLLLGVEREGVLLAVVAGAAATSVAEGEPASVGAAATPSVAAGPATNIGAGHAQTAHGREARAADVKPTPLPRAEVALPRSSEVPDAVRRTTAEAAHLLKTVDDVARLSTPLVLYDRRLQDVEATLAALSFGDHPSGALARSTVDEILGYHHTARDIRRAKLEALARQGANRRVPSSNAMPYFSDSQVPDWIALYPFLEGSLLERPRESRLPLPGEIAGRWDPDRALNLLWSHARARTARLAEWAGAA